MRTPEQILKYCKRYPGIWDTNTPVTHILEFAAMAVIDLPLMAQRVLELEAKLREDK